MQGASISTQPLISPGTPKLCSEGLRALQADPAGVDGSTSSAFWFWLSFFFFFFNSIGNREQTQHLVWVQVGLGMCNTSRTPG